MLRVIPGIIMYQKIEREQTMAKGGMGLRKGIVFAFIAIIAVMLGCLFVLLSLVSVGVQSAKPDERPGDSGIIVGFSQIGAESAWRKHNTQSIHEAARSRGIRLLYENAEQKKENQIKAIRSFIAYRVDVIAFAPLVADGWDNVLREAKEAGIPVLATDRKLETSDESLYAGFIGTDSMEEGRNAARFIIKKFSNGSPYNKYRKEPVKIIEIAGTDGSSPAQGRARGFREGLAGHDNFVIIHSEDGDFLRSKGYEIANRILEEYPVIDVIYSHNDSMTLGIIDSMKEKGIRPGKDIIIVTIDAEQAAIDALRAGEVNCVIECNPKFGPDIMDLAIRLAEGKEIPRLLHVEEQVFTEDDPDLDSIPPRGY